MQVLLLMGLATAWTAVLAGAQDNAPTNAATPPPPATGETVVAELPKDLGTPEGASVGTPANTNLITITLDDVELVDVIRMFTRLSGANIIVSATNLAGRVTVNLVDVEWKPALQSILEMNNLSMEEKSPGSGVYTVTAGAPDPMKVKTFFLKYTTVGTVEPVIRPMLIPGASLSTFPSKNAMIIKSLPRNLEDIDSVILHLDRLREQVFIETKFMELNDGAIKDLGINWQSLQEVSLGVGNLNRSLSWNSSRSDSINRGDSRQNSDGINRQYNMNGSLFSQPVVTPATVDAQGNVISPAQSVIPPTRTIGDTIARNQDAASSVQNTFTDARTAVLGASDFKIILSALQQISGITIVSNPKILVANEEPATIHIGERERPFVSSVTPGQQGIAPIVTYNPGDPVDTGVKLMVTPTVNTESNITVKIEPELTRFVRNATAPNGQTYPVITTKRIKTVFCLESGKTVAIGGLTDTQDRDETKKIPILGDIPILGKYLFSHTHKEKSQQETIIFVTVGLATPNAIRETTGLPEDAELAQRQLLKSRARLIEKQGELKTLQDTLSKESSKRTATLNKPAGQSEKSPTAAPNPGTQETKPEKTVTGGEGGTTTQPKP